MAPDLLARYTHDRPHARWRLDPRWLVSSHCFIYKTFLFPSIPLNQPSSPSFWVGSNLHSSTIPLSTTFPWPYDETRYAGHFLRDVSKKASHDTMSKTITYHPHPHIPADRDIQCYIIARIFTSLILDIDFYSQLFNLSYFYILLEPVCCSPTV
jgi:hypothetical protein